MGRPCAEGVRGKLSLARTPPGPVAAMFATVIGQKRCFLEDVPPSEIPTLRECPAGGRVR